MKLETAIRNDFKQTKIYYVCCSEFEGMYDAKGTLLYYWSTNDAVWRHEFFDELLRVLGVTVANKTPGKIQRKFEQYIKKMYGEY